MLLAIMRGRFAQCWCIFYIYWCSWLLYEEPFCSLLMYSLYILMLVAAIWGNILLTADVYFVYFDACSCYMRKHFAHCWCVFQVPSRLCIFLHWTILCNQQRTEHSASSVHLCCTLPHSSTRHIWYLQTDQKGNFFTPQSHLWLSTLT